MTTKLEALITETAEFVDSLDRTPLGSFAIPRERLIAAIAVRKGVRDISGDKELARAVTEWLVDVSDAENLEAIYWTNAETYFSQELTDEVAVIARLASSPVSYHDFFRVGIWNESDIESYLAAGIDAELAGSLNV